MAQGRGLTADGAPSTMRPMPSRERSAVDEGSHVCFFAESQVGIGSVARTLKPFAQASRAPAVDWVDVTYVREGGLLERLPAFGRARGTARGFRQVSEGLRRKHDALLFLTHNPAVLHPLAVRRTPTLLWTDVTPLLLDRQASDYEHPETGRLLGKLKHAAVRSTFHAARTCAAWSEWARRSFVEDYGVPEERTAVIPPGVDLERWPAPERGPRGAGPFKLLFVGGDFARKGGPLLLEVFRELRGRCELDVVTRDPVAEEPGVRVHHGLTPGSAGLLALYRGADAFVLPTRADCHSIASLEAMAMGLPVLLTRVGAAAEIVEHGKSGFLLERGDGRSLREGLEALLSGAADARALGSRGLQIVRQTFDAARTMRLLLERSLAG